MSAVSSGMRRVRLALIVLAVLLTAGFVFSSRSAWHLRHGSFIVGLHSGSLEVGWLTYRFAGTRVVRQLGPITVERGWASMDAGAWRPYRAAMPGGPSRLVVPLWGPMVLAAGGAAMAHGVIVGRRKARVIHDCAECGYDLSHCPCPECGPGRERRAGASPQGV